MPTTKTKFFADHYGIGIDSGGSALIPCADMMDSQLGMDTIAKLRVAYDAATAPTNALQPELITQSNAGIPAQLTNLIDPEIVRVLTTPLKAVQIWSAAGGSGEVKKGDWTTDSVQFPMTEFAGEVSSYGDNSMNGRADSNANWEPRQAYHYQVITEWGDKELARAALAKIDRAAEKNLASAFVMNTFQNWSYFYGVSGLDNYGLLNDPSLSAPLAPLSGTWKAASVAGTGAVIVADILDMFVQIQSQVLDNLTMDDPLVLVMAPEVQPYLLTPMQNVYGTPSVKAYLKEAFPKIVIETAAQYATPSGNLVQMIAPMVQGQKTGFACFTEKLRAHRVVSEMSSIHQKKSGGTFGSIIKFPAGISQKLGV